MLFSTSTAPSCSFSLPAKCCWFSCPLTMRTEQKRERANDSLSAACKVYPSNTSPIKKYIYRWELGLVHRTNRMKESRTRKEKRKSRHASANKVWALLSDSFSPLSDAHLTRSIHRRRRNCHHHRRRRCSSRMIQGNSCAQFSLPYDSPWLPNEERSNRRHLLKKTSYNSSMFARDQSLWSNDHA